mmetsp:Transcript_23398/g.72499  ORF Transcript_23398/g.72499 Transcript_23398/m.72499 type:complete len:301 (+) Transcript_23398:763-1665(+)
MDHWLRHAGRVRRLLRQRRRGAGARPLSHRTPSALLAAVLPQDRHRARRVPRAHRHLRAGGGERPRGAAAREGGGVARQGRGRRARRGVQRANIGEAGRRVRVPLCRDVAVPADHARHRRRRLLSLVGAVPLRLRQRPGAHVGDDCRRGLPRCLHDPPPGRRRAHRPTKEARLPIPPRRDIPRGDASGGAGTPVGAVRQGRPLAVPQRVQRLRVRLGVLPSHPDAREGPHVPRDAGAHAQLDGAARRDHPRPGGVQPHHLLLGALRAHRVRCHHGRLAGVRHDHPRPLGPAARRRLLRRT